MKKLTAILENFDNQQVSKTIKDIEAIQDTLREELKKLKDLERDLRKNGLSTDARRLESYIIGHLATIIDKNNDYGSSNPTLEDIKNDVQGHAQSEEPNNR